MSCFCGDRAPWEAVRMPHRLGWYRGELERLRKNLAAALGVRTPSSALYRPPSEFRVHAWRWHHIALERDLGRLQVSFSRHRAALCTGKLDSQARRERLARAFAFIVKANWIVHDWVEEVLFVPFVLSLDGGVHPSHATLRQIATNRNHLAQARSELGSRIDRWASSDSGDSCSREALRMSRALADLRLAAQTAFNTSERALAPVVAKLAPRAKQEIFNKAVISALDGGRARLALVMFRDAVVSSRRFESRATSQDKVDFETSIPKPVRMLIPVWRRNLLGDLLSVLDELDSAAVVSND
jgi:hypothetical protein